jgi:L-fuculose-phosphate aldolase
LFESPKVGAPEFRNQLSIEARFCQTEREGSSESVLFAVSKGVVMNREDDEKLRGEFIVTCEKLHHGGFIAATDGNVSCRLKEGLLLITPSGKAKGELQREDLLVVDLEGHVVQGSGRPSSEIRMHLLVYRMRRDVSAVVHAHPPMLTAFTLCDLPFPSDCLPEVWLTIGPVPTAPYATPSTEEVPRSIAPLVAAHEAILLERHGSLTFGKDLPEAFMRLQKLEHAAHTLYYACLLKREMPSPLLKEALEKLRQLGHGKR